MTVEVPTFASTSARPSLSGKEQDRIETGDSTCPFKGSWDNPLYATVTETILGV